MAALPFRPGEFRLGQVRQIAFEHRRVVDRRALEGCAQLLAMGARVGRFGGAHALVQDLLGRGRDIRSVDVDESLRLERERFQPAPQRRRRDGLEKH